MFLGGAHANAKSSYDSAYGFDRTWNAAMRLVRVDMGLKVTEKDDSTGYLLFDYHSSESGTKVTPGSIEVVRPREPGTPVRVLVQLPEMPRYHEQVMIDSLTRKMRQEYGEAPAPAPRMKTPPHDAGAEGNPQTP